LGIWTQAANVRQQHDCEHQYVNKNSTCLLCTINTIITPLAISAVTLLLHHGLSGPAV